MFYIYTYNILDGSGNVENIIDEAILNVYEDCISIKEIKNNQNILHCIQATNTYVQNNNHRKIYITEYIVNTFKKNIKEDDKILEKIIKKINLYHGKLGVSQTSKPFIEQQIIHSLSLVIKTYRKSKSIFIDIIQFNKNNTQIIPKYINCNCLHCKSVVKKIYNKSYENIDNIMEHVTTQKYMQITKKITYEDYCETILNGQYSKILNKHINNCKGEITISFTFNSDPKTINSSDNIINFCYKLICLRAQCDQKKFNHICEKVRFSKINDKRSNHNYKVDLYIDMPDDLSAACKISIIAYYIAAIKIFVYDLKNNDEINNQNWNTKELDKYEIIDSIYQKIEQTKIKTSIKCPMCKSIETNKFHFKCPHCDLHSKTMITMKKEEQRIVYDLLHRIQNKLEDKISPPIVNNTMDLCTCNMCIEKAEKYEEELKEDYEVEHINKYMVLKNIKEEFYYKK